MLWSNFAYLAVAFLLGAGLTGLVRTYAQRVNLVDVPNQRSSHETATPRGGGLSIVIAVVGATAAFIWKGDDSSAEFLALLCSALLVATIGFIDDHRHVPASARFAFHVIAAAILTYVIGGFAPVQIGNYVADFGLVGDVLAIVFVVWFTNAFNFMDGIDGIAALETISISGVAALFLAYSGGEKEAVILGVMAAASLGFLIWNFPPAKIFMGDVGSGFLGFVLAAVALTSSARGLIPIWPWLILAGVFIVDATVTLTTRIIRGDRWHRAHRLHAYQILARKLNSHLSVTLGVATINVLWLTPLAYTSFRNPEQGWWLTIVAWIPLIFAAIYLGAGRADRQS